MTEDLELRMYCLVPYNLSFIQMGIQSLHGVQEYNNGASVNRIVYEKSLTENFLINVESLRESFIKWSTIDKTVILLNGGPTNWDIESKGMREHFNLLKENNIPFSYFQEPDLNNALTAICFLVDERVYDKKKYPEYNEIEAYHTVENKLKWKYLLKTVNYYKEADDLLDIEYDKWVESIGGKSNVFLRKFLKDKRLA